MDALSHNFEQTLAIAEFEQEGRGVKVLRDLSPGELVIEVPAELLLSATTAEESKDFQSLISNELFEKLSNDDKICLFLLRQVQLGSDSPWHLHMKMLPKHVHSVLFFSQEEIEQLTGSNLYTIGLRLQQQVIDDYEQLCSLIFRTKPNVFSEEYYSLDRYRWSLSMLWSRAMDVKTESGERRFMVPFVDMINHHGSAQVRHYFDSQSKSLKVRTEQRFNAGDQLFLFYGNFSNYDLLRLYGFSIANNSFDRVDLWAPLNPDDQLFTIKAQLLKQNGIKHDGPYALTMDTPLPPGLLVAIRVQLSRSLSEMHTAFPPTSFVSTENEHTVLSVLLCALQRMLSGYETTLAEDLQASSARSQTATDIKHLLIGEKRILTKAIKELEQRLLS